jgi:hypothetical protein
MNKVIEKYDRKRILIVESVYRIEIISTTAELSVYLHPISGGDIAYSKFDTDSYPYTHGGKTYRLAVDKAKEIQLEIERNTETDF